MVERAELGGRTRRERPTAGLRPTIRFVIVMTLTAVWVAFGVYVSAPWRADLEEAFGPVLAWLIPIMLAYIPGVVVGFLASTLILTPYEPPSLDPPEGPWPVGEWPSVTLLIAARNEEEVIVRTLEHVADQTYRGSIEVVLADNGSDDRTAERAAAAAARLGLRYRRVFEPEPGKYRALNAALATVEAPLLVTVDADTFLQQESLRYLIARVTARPQDQHACACAGALVVENRRSTSSPGCRGGTSGSASTG
jgi:poly-beta-1,6-N-acetyl-D-glucosamine synthase